LNSHGNPTTDIPIECFDYQAELRSNQIAYIVSRYPELTKKMARDPAFDLVFINAEVAVFMVKRNFN
jgi:hypothetical protein